MGIYLSAVQTEEFLLLSEQKKNKPNQKSQPPNIAVKEHFFLTSVLLHGYFSVVFLANYIMKGWVLPSAAFPKILKKKTKPMLF